MTNIIIAILGSGALSTLISVIAGAIQKRMEKDTDTKKAVRLCIYYQLKDTALKYINANYIDPDDLKCLIESHDVYKNLGGDGFTESLINQCKKLEIKEGKL